MGKNTTFAHLYVLKDSWILCYDSSKKRHDLDDGWESVYAVLEENNKGKPSHRAGEPSHSAEKS